MFEKGNIIELYSRSIGRTLGDIYPERSEKTDVVDVQVETTSPTPDTKPRQYNSLGDV